MSHSRMVLSSLEVKKVLGSWLLMEMTGLLWAGLGGMDLFLW